MKINFSNLTRSSSAYFRGIIFLSASACFLCFYFYFKNQLTLFLFWFILFAILLAITRQTAINIPLTLPRRHLKISTVSVFILFIFSCLYFINSHWLFNSFLKFNPLAGAIISIIIFLTLVLAVFIFWSKEPASFSLLRIFSSHKSANLKTRLGLLLLLGLAITGLAFIIKNEAGYAFIKMELHSAYFIFSSATFYFSITIITLSLGRKIFDWLKIKFENKLAHLLFSIGIGFIPIFFGIFCLASLASLYTWTILSFFLLIVLFSAKEIKKTITGIVVHKFAFHCKSLRDYLTALVSILAIAILAINSINASFPQPIDQDSLHSYYNAPKLYLEYHQIKPLAHYAHANMAQNIEMLFAGVLGILDDRFIVHFSFLFLLLSLAALYCVLEYLLTRKHAALGTLAAFLIPWNFLYIRMSKTDLAMNFYLALIVLAFVFFQKNYEKKYLYLLGILAGISFGIKYNAVLLIIPTYVLIFWLIISHHKKNQAMFFHFFVSILLALIFFSPWAIKNYVFFHNPIFPYNVWPSGGHTFVSSALDFNGDYTKERGKEVSFLKHAYASNGNPLINHTGMIWKQSLQSGVVPYDFGPWPLLICLFLILFADKKKNKNLSGLIFLYFLMHLLLSAGRPWYAMFGVMLLSSLLPLMLLRFKTMLISYIAFIAVLLPSIIIVYPHNAGYLSGKISKEKFLKEQVANLDLAEFINSLNISNKDKILLEADLRLIGGINHSDQKTYIDLNFAICGNASDSDERSLYDALKSASISYVVYGENGGKFIDDWLVYKNISESEYLKSYQGKIPSIYEDKKKFEKMLAGYATPIQSGSYATLYKLN